MVYYELPAPAGDTARLWAKTEKRKRRKWKQNNFQQPHRRENWPVKQAGQFKPENGDIYFGATLEERVAEQRRDLIYGVRNAIKHLADLATTPEEWLNEALPYQLWRLDERAEILDALAWLSDLKEAWEDKHGPINHAPPRVATHDA